MSTTVYSPPGVDLYRIFGLTDRRSDNARAEEALELVLAVAPDLAPSGWCEGFTRVDDVLWFRRGPGMALRPHLVDAFVWARIFVSLGCHGVASHAWTGVSASRLARLAEEASERALGRRIIDSGVMCAAALSLGIPVRKHEVGPDAQVAVRLAWEYRQ